MAVVQMKSVSVIGMMQHFDEVVKICGESEIFHPEEAIEFYSETENFVPVASKNVAASYLEKISSFMDKTGIKKALIDTEDFDPDIQQIEKYVDELSSSLGKMLSDRDALAKETNQCKQRIENASHFIGLGLEIEKLRDCEFVAVDFGKLPKESYKKLKTLDLEKDNINFFPCTSDDYYYWGVYITTIDNASDADRIFSGLYFEHCEISGFEGTPNAFYEQQKTLLSQLEVNGKNLDVLIDVYVKENTATIQKYYSKLLQYNEFFKIKNYAYKYNNNFIISGWISAKEEKRFTKILKTVESVEVETESAKKELKHSPPVKLKNSFIARPFEYYTKMYGLPNYTEVDPTTFVALTYIILFGIMFGDLGQGFVLLIASLIMWKIKKMELGKLLISCSVSSMIFGTLYGSVFGFEHWLDPLYTQVFGLEEKPIEVMAPEMTMPIIIISVAIGMVLLLMAMLLNIYSSAKRKNFGHMLFDTNGVCGFLFYGSIVAGVAGIFLFDTNLFTTPYIIGFIVLPIVLIFFREPLSKLVNGDKNWKPEKIGGFLVDNAFEMFEIILSFLTNTMSFLRVGSFVLVHAGMMQVVFVLAEMFGDVGFVVTVVLGNALVLVLEALLVGIQVLRLEFCEMFNRFYIGDGRPYEPITTKKI